MRRFRLVAIAYIVACLLGGAAIVIRGDGPHPRILAIYPPNGDRFWPGGAAQITFSQSMDQSSVERALQVSPGAQGQGAWYGNTLNLQPVGDWQPNVTYHVRLVGKVTDDQGRPLPTPISFWFEVHHVQHLTFCRVGGERNVCEPLRSGIHVLTHSARPVLAYALSSDGTLLAYTHRDRSGLPHLFIIGVDGTGARELTSGNRYADSHPFFAYGDSSSVTYIRRPITLPGGRVTEGKPQTWNVEVDGSENARV